MSPSQANRPQSPRPPVSLLSPPSLPSSTSEATKMDDNVYDLVGIGFGPANLALAIALRESSEAQESKLNFTFIEKQDAFAWHSSLLLPGAQLQVSPLKDLATMRDPTSSYTFFNYLHQKGRLAAYINREANVPSRREWSAYLTWAAKRMDDVVTYSQEVVSVEPVQKKKNNTQQETSTLNAHVQYLRITTRDIKNGEKTIRLAKNITVGVGGVPRLPLAFHHLYRPFSADDASRQQIAHSSTYLPSLAALQPMLLEREAKRLSLASDDPDLFSTSSSSSSPSLDSSPPAPLRFAVIGGGQSSAEISLHLRKTFPRSDVKLIFRSSALVPSDDSPFVNSAAFDPHRTDVFWQGNEESRKAWLEEYRRTNYSVVRSDVLNEIDTNLYDQTIDFDQPWPNADGLPSHGKLQLLANTQVDKVEYKQDKGGMVQLSMTSTKLIQNSKVDTFDAVFLGTGFERQPNAIKFLQPVKEFFPLLDEENEQRKAELGFVEEVESEKKLNELMNSSDDYAVERLRQRTRGISRDYRLVSYWSDAFTHHPCNLSTERGRGQESGSGASSPTRSSATSSAVSSSETLGNDDDEEAIANGRIFEPSIFFLGGNEQTHGLSDSLLSIVAHRAGELCETIVKSRTQDQDQHQDMIKYSLSTVVNNQTTASRASLKKIPIETLEEKVQTLRAA